MSLDRIDKKILKALQQDGRITNSELALQIGISKSACWNHTKRLMDEGYIQHVKATLNPNLLDLSVIVCVGVVLDRSTPESFDLFEQAIKEIRVVSECLLLAGEFDYWLKIRVKDLKGFNRFHYRTLLALPGVRQLRTFFVLKEVANNTNLEID